MENQRKTKSSRGAIAAGVFIALCENQGAKNRRLPLPVYMLLIRKFIF